MLDERMGSFGGLVPLCVQGRLVRKEALLSWAACLAGARGCREVRERQKQREPQLKQSTADITCRIATSVLFHMLETNFPPETKYAVKKILHGV